MVQNYLMDNVNAQIEKWINTLSHENVFFLSSNSRNTPNLSNTALLLGDMTHKIPHNEKMSLPFPLWLDTNYILNFACNQLIGVDSLHCEH